MPVRYDRLTARFVDPAPGVFARYDTLRGRRVVDFGAAHPRCSLPAPTALPSLHAALARRAAVFGPFDVDPPQAPPRGRLRGLGGLLCLGVASLVSRALA